jgi:hypothetical protein
MGIEGSCPHRTAGTLAAVTWGGAAGTHDTQPAREGSRGGCQSRKAARPPATFKLRYFLGGGGSAGLPLGSGFAPCGIGIFRLVAGIAPSFVKVAITLPRFQRSS